jgi:molybdopterin converting factor small subunit
MIKFFRHIRKSLIKQNKTGKYLKYAIGEVILVMIGILLALQVNNWNEARKQRIAEQELYRTLISSLESDLDDVTEKISSIKQSLSAQETFILKNFNDIQNSYSINEVSDLLINVNNSSWSFFPNYGLYNKITNNNQLDLIQSQNLQMKIIELYEQYYKRYNDIDLNLEEQMVFSFSNNYFSKIEDASIKSDRYYKIDFETLERHYNILNDECRKIHSLTVIAHSAMVDCKNQLELVISLLKKELKE